METPVVRTGQKNYHDTLDESIIKMKLAFGNASLPEIFVVMVTVGYTLEKIAALNAELAQLEDLYQDQIKEHADQSEEQDKMNNKRAEISPLFNTHRSLMRVLLKGDVHSWVALNLSAEVPSAFAAWSQMVSNFYGQFAKNPDLLLKAQGIGITQVVAQSQILALAELLNNREDLRKETADAQKATDARDSAFDALYPKYAEYIKYAKILLPNNQLLEALGIRVR